MKPDTALLPPRNPFYYPEFTNDLHHEVEMVIKIKRLGKKIEQQFAHRYYDEIGIGIDFTARDLQRKCKEKGLPWERAKAFDHSAPVSPKFLNKSVFEDLNNINFSMRKNGEVVQQGNTKDLLFSFDYLIAHISQFCMLKIGDLIFTGTPAGVGPVAIGDRLECFIEEQKMLAVNIK